jgi:hypothetical protein
MADDIILFSEPEDKVFPSRLGSENAGYVTGALLCTADL